MNDVLVFEVDIGKIKRRYFVLKHQRSFVWVLHSNGNVLSRRRIGHFYRTSIKYRLSDL